MTKAIKQAAIVTALMDLIDRAPSEQRNRLAQAIEDYAESFPNAWAAQTSGDRNPFLADLLDAMTDAADANVIPGEAR